MFVGQEARWVPRTEFVDWHARVSAFVDRCFDATHGSWSSFERLSNRLTVFVLRERFGQSETWETEIGLLFSFFSLIISYLRQG